MNVHYDGNGNLIQTKDEDGYITEYGYSPVNLVNAANYADGKKATNGETGSRRP